MKMGPAMVGCGYVFETDTLNFGVDKRPRWSLNISAAGTFSRDDVEFIRDALTTWLAKHEDVNRG